MDRVIAQISQTMDWEDLIALERTLANRDLIDEDVRTELDRHAHMLARRYLIKRGKLDSAPFSAAEEETLDVLAAAVVVLRRSQQLPHNIVKCLRTGGLIGTVEHSVRHSSGLQYSANLEEDGVTRSLLEAIVIRHPVEFDADIVKAASLRTGQPLEELLKAVS
ncbi:hypothetical protein [Pseudomonas oleovorans]|uniref:hypothetical protein n=1 Tax=Ectopseudomonas oleovorans TaxID=301 RepID=UPI000E25C5AA|nr:hypothetical protein [Pseudomonas oleovorans]